MTETKETETGTQEESKAEEHETITRFPFPKTFYDPDTKKLMLHPVVGPDGESHEKSDDLESAVEYYLNRALQSYIDEELDRFVDTGSMRGTLLHWKESMRSGFQQLVEKSALPSGEYRPLPDAFYCPISFDLIHEPAIDPDGHTYERAAIVHWLKNNDNSPITRNPLAVDQLRDNNALLSVLEHLTEADEPEAVHPSIRRWKTEHSTRMTATPAADADAASHASPIVTDATNYASNMEELENLRLEQDQRGLVVATMCMVLCLFLGFFPFYFFEACIIIFPLFLLNCCYAAARERRIEQIVQIARMNE